MEFIQELHKTPVVGQYDVIVVGGGPAGVGAALSAARNGASTLLIEQHAFLGGMWTAGFMNPLFDVETKHEGLVFELVNELKSRGQWGGFWDKSFNYEYMKCILEEKAIDAGVTLLYNTSFSKAIVDDGTV